MPLGDGTFPFVGQETINEVRHQTQNLFSMAEPNLRSRKDERMFMNMSTGYFLLSSESLPIYIRDWWEDG